MNKPLAPTAVVVDGRWKGHFGIGRYSSEVVSRLRVPFALLPDDGRAGRATDLWSSARCGLRSTDVLYSPGFNAGLTPARQLLTVHDLIHLDVPEERSWAKRAFYHSVLKPAICTAGLVFTVSKSSAARITEWLDAPHVRIVNAGNGLSDPFRAENDDGPERAAYTFLFVGDARPHKNLELVFRVLRQRPAYRLAIVARDVAGIGSLAQRYGVNDQLEIHLRPTDVALRDLYRRCTALLFPSRVEGFGLPVAEGAACGAPVVYWAGCSGVAELMAGAGIAVPTLSLADWLAAVDLVGAGTETTDQSAVRARILSSCSWESVAHQVNAELAGAIAPAGAAA